ncbi:hypothetical protein CRE_28629 [Caenorhabditis remanei]|uniref:Galactosylgalactosylxylosylprotein 3-beta-glucuronosyltransferase n=1 Tax=Caenorhabditis remanei TaxID=31234 RepID=E3LNC2_CAERE|nr:hypothetical protein CRE_28629 [Caenorhabditis remanei]
MLVLCSLLILIARTIPWILNPSVILTKERVQKEVPTVKPIGLIVSESNEKDEQESRITTEGSSTLQTIIVVTPTYKRLTRVADFTRLANTLSHLSNLYWIVIEDGPETVPVVQKMLERTNLNFTYMAHPSPPNYPNRGWYQRTMALKYIRENYTNFMRSQNGVVYFGDDDNSYDLRLFEEYIRKVNKIGMWGVGHVAGSLVESPRVSNQKVVGFDAEWSPDRYFAIDMAGFALGLQLILESDAVFRSSCPSGTGALESCLLTDLGLNREDVEPFGFEKENEREVLVWHTKTLIPDIYEFRPSAWNWLFPKPPKTNGYFVEY